MSFEKYEIIIENPESGAAELHHDVCIDGKLSSILFVKKGFTAAVRLKIINPQPEQTKFKKIYWIFAVKNNHQWDEIGWQGETGLSMVVDGNAYEYAQSQKVLVVGHSSFTLGALYWLEPFFDCPEFTETANPKGIYVSFIDEPQIIDLCFSHQEQTEFPKEAIETDFPVVKYGEPVYLYLKSHRLPDGLAQYHTFGGFEITVYSEKTHQPVSAPMTYYQSVEKSSDTLQTLTRIPIITREEWRTEVNHQPGEDQGFYVQIKSALYYNEKAQLPTTVPEEPVIPSFETVNLQTIFEQAQYRKRSDIFRAPNDQQVEVTYLVPRYHSGKHEPYMGINLQEKTDFLSRILAKAYHKTAESTSITKHRFYIPYDTQSDIRQRQKRKQNNMFVEVADQLLKVKNGFPCKYTAIRVQQNNRVFSAFQETDQGILDHTPTVFGVIAGDQKAEKITITLDNLSAKRCRVANKDDQHTHLRNVFKLATIKPSLLEKYILRRQPVPRDILTEQQLIEGTDYTLEGNTMTFFVKYPYIRAYDSLAEQWLGIGTDAIATAASLQQTHIAWIVRYMIMNPDHAMPYILPINSCAYPDQTVRIKVYPDFEWWVNIKYNSDQPLYVKQTPNYRHREFIIDPHENRRKNGNYQAERGKSGFNTRGYQLGIEAKYRVNGQDYGFDTGTGIPILNAVQFLLGAYERLKKLTFADETEREEQKAARGVMAARGKYRRTQKLPVRIEVSKPSFSLGVHGCYAPSKTNNARIGSLYTFKAQFNPLVKIKGTLDMLFFAEQIPPLKAIVKSITTIADTAKLLTFGAVNLEYRLDLIASGEADMDLPLVTYHSIDGWGGVEMKIDLQFTIGLIAEGKVSINIPEAKPINATIGAEANAGFRITATYDKRTHTCPGTVTFEGLNAELYMKFKATNKKDSDEEEINEEKPKIVRILEPQSWQVNLL